MDNSTMKTQSYRRVGTSRKRAKENARYRRLRKVFVENNEICFFCAHYVKPHEREIHHFYGKIECLLTWIPGFRLVHRGCHRWIEEHRKEASESGYRAPENLFGYPSRVFKLYGENA